MLPSITIITDLCEKNMMTTPGYVALYAKKCKQHLITDAYYHSVLNKVVVGRVSFAYDGR